MAETQKGVSLAEGRGEQVGWQRPVEWGEVREQ